MKRIRLALAVIFGAALCCAIMAGCSSSKDEPENQVDAIADEVSDVSEDAAAVTKETEPFWVLVVGNDSRIGTTQIDDPDYSDGKGRSDTIMLVRVDPVNYNLCVVTVPRDTTATVNGETLKINDSYRQGGIEALEDQVTQLTGVTPKYSLDLGFVTFQQFIDAFGGVTVDVPCPVTLKDVVAGGPKITIDAGDGQLLDGVHALIFARARHDYGDNLDACRQIQDRQIVTSAINQVLNDPENVSKYFEALSAVVETNWDKRSFEALVKDFVDHAGDVTIRTGTGPYAGDIDPTTELWLAYRDEDTWARVIEAANNGDDINEIVPLPEVYPASH